MPPTQHEAGLVADNTTIHAVRKAVAGPNALCGAGWIVQLVPGRFNTDVERACRTCADLAD